MISGKKKRSGKSTPWPPLWLRIRRSSSPVGKKSVPRAHAPRHGAAKLNWAATRKFWSRIARICSIFVHIYPYLSRINMNQPYVSIFVICSATEVFLMLQTNHSGRGKSFSGLKLLCQHWCKGQTAGTPRFGWTPVVLWIDLSCWEFPGAHINIAGTLNASSSPTNCAIGTILPRHISKKYTIWLFNIAMEDHHF